MTWAKGNCTEAFSACRSLEDSALSLITACNTDTATLLYKAKVMASNLASATSVATQVAAAVSAATSGRRTLRDAATTCAGFVAQLTEYNALLENPTASTTEVKAKETDILAYDTSTSCTADELTSLKTQKTALETLVVLLTANYNEAQSKMECKASHTYQLEFEKQYDSLVLLELN